MGSDTRARAMNTRWRSPPESELMLSSRRWPNLTVSMAAQAGQLELNVMMPVMAFNINFTIEILKNAVREFTNRCVKGITANADQCRHYAEISPSLATALNSYIGYARAAEVVKKALREKKSIPQVVREEKLLTEDQIRSVLDPTSLTEPGLPGKKT